MARQQSLGFKVYPIDQGMRRLDDRPGWPGFLAWFTHEVGRQQWLEDVCRRQDPVPWPKAIKERASRSDRIDRKASRKAGKGSRRRF